jgi:hypothetical protein
VTSSHAGSGDQGQAAQCGVAHGPVGLRVATQRGPGSALDPLGNRAAEHPASRSGLQGLLGQLGRDLNQVRVTVRRARGGGTRRGVDGHWRVPGRPGARLTLRVQAARRPPPLAGSLRIRAWLTAWAATCELREGIAPLTLGFT